MSAAPDIAEDSRPLRDALIATARAMNAAGINVNASGNVSARCMRGARSGFVVTPSGMPYDAIGAGDVVFVALDGAASGTREPSSEWRFHRDIYAARPAFAAIVHTHSVYASALACHGRGLPAFHYMAARAGGADIRCAPYATFGTQALSDATLAALAERSACLLAHHGVVACGDTLDSALALAVDVEHLARMYLAAFALGEPPLLSDDEMQRVLQRFQTYGPRRSGGH